MNITEFRMYQKNDIFLPIQFHDKETGMFTYTDLYRMQHLLVGGATAQGKTTFLYHVICSLYFNAITPCKFVIMSQHHEFSKLNSIGIGNLISETDKGISMLHELLELANTRMETIEKQRGSLIKFHPTDDIPFIIVMIDEFADWTSKFNDFETLLKETAMWSHRVGIHFIVTTSLFTNSVISGCLKAIIPARMAFRVITQADSRMILDTNGAESLLRQGDTILSFGGKTITTHVPNITEKYVCKVIENDRYCMSLY